MMQIENPAERVELDPQDWSAMRAIGRRMVDDALCYLESVRERPVWQPVPDATRERLREPLPHEGVGAEAAYDEFLELIQPYPYGNIHPRFWAWVNGTGTPFTVLAELLAATMNPNAYGSDAAQYYVERQVLGWLKQLLRLPETESGILVSGGSVANFIGLAAALNDRAEVDIVRDGLQAAPRAMVMYASQETHHSVLKAARLLGLGSRSVRHIPTGSDYAIRLPELRAAIEEDRRADRLPFCVVGNAGTVKTGAFDPLREIAEICAEEKLWFHVDGAYGALAAASPKYSQITAGMDRADSLAFDLHKWLFMPIEVGCAFVKDPAAHRKAFAIEAEYLMKTPRGIAAIEEPFGDLGLQLTRGFRALKVWMGLKELGAWKYVRAIEQNVELARYMETLVEDEPETELLARVTLNVVCFRYVFPQSVRDQDKLNQDILIGLQEEGVAAFSGVSLLGRFGVRAAITNHRTRREDIDIAFQAVLRFGRQICSQQSHLAAHAEGAAR